ncbi:MAG: hypothetical protein OXC80_11795, partial [Gammaproteobacteria bacterium]|nr:hypothetical protein [Gammaproteobacteria bacterium]
DTTREEIGEVAARLFRSLGKPTFYETLKEALNAEIRPYDIQSAVAKLRQQNGDEVTGWKVGCISSTVQRQLGIDEPVYGRLFRSQTSRGAQRCSLSGFERLGIEGELAVELGRDLRPDSDHEEILRSIDWIFPLIEVHHLPPSDWILDHRTIIGSNGLHAGFIKGGLLPFDIDELEGLDMSIYIEGVVDQLISGSELSNGLLNTLTWLPKRLANDGHALRAGDTVLCGTLADLYDVNTPSKIRVCLASESTVEMELIP